MKVDKYIKARLNEFHKLGSTGETIFDFSPFLHLKLKATLETELIFCICTANSSALSGLKVQKELQNKNVYELDKRFFSNLLKESGVRFHSKKASYITKALRKFDSIRDALRLGDFASRDFLVKRIKGLGYKEASHFLRNTGRRSLAILDRHVLKWLFNKGIVEERKILSRKKYLEIESLLLNFARKQKMDLAGLDLLIWYKSTGKILK